MHMKKIKRKRTKDHILTRRDIIILISLLAAVVVMISFADVFQHKALVEVIDKNVLGLKAGDIATKDVVAKDAVYYIDSLATEDLQQEAVDSVIPVFRVSLTRSLYVLEQLSSVKTVLLSEDLSDKEKIRQLETQGIDQLFIGNDLQNMLSYTDDELNFLFSFSEELLIQLFKIGIYGQQELALSGSPTEIQLVRIDSSGKNKTDIVKIDTLLTMDTLPEYLSHLLESKSDRLHGFKDAVIKVVDTLATENVIYDSITTQKMRKDARQSISPVIKTIEKGELVLKSGFLVTDEAVEKIRALEQGKVSQSPIEIIGRVLFYLILTITFASLVYRMIPNTLRKKQYLYIIVSLVLIYISIYSAIILQLFDRNIIFVAIYTPIILFSMLVTIIINKNVSIAVTAYLSLIAFSIPEIHIIGMLYIVSLGVSGALIVNNAKRRIDLIRSTGIVSVLSVLLCIEIGLVFNEDLDWFTTHGLTAGIVSMISGIIVVVVLPILEHIFNLPTGFRLIELTTMNSKVLKRMAVMARGTYSHSVAVADLAETACEAIGVNHLLARVGAYYHDIGKLDQPEYFIENQKGGNKHDDLKPSLSVVVIKSHVKVGIEKAKAIGLPQEVIDIIAQHHGSDVISYFYREALMNNENGSKIAPEDFSYNGTPPMTKEAAVVMLADSVDAVSRTLKKPTTTKLEKIIWKVIIDKIEHKQLDNCDLSIKELEIIKDSFILILTGRFHKRIEYQKDSGRKY